MIVLEYLPESEYQPGERLQKLANSLESLELELEPNPELPLPPL